MEGILLPQKEREMEGILLPHKKNWSPKVSESCLLEFENAAVDEDVDMLVETVTFFCLSPTHTHRHIPLPSLSFHLPPSVVDAVMRIIASASTGLWLLHSPHPPRSRRFKRRAMTQRSHIWPLAPFL